MLLRNDKGEFLINDYLAQLVTDDIYDEVYESVIIGSTCKSILVKQKEYI